MFTRQRLSYCLLFALLSCAAARAQEDAPARQQPSGPPVTIVAAGAGVRFAALGPVERLRLEVFDARGEMVFDTGLRPGNVRDWRLTDAQGGRLPDGTYLCVVTARDLAGRLTFKQGNILIEGGRAALALDDSVRASAIEPGQPSGQPSAAEPPAMAVVAHDGADGQVTSTAGALSFRTGDFFSGKEVERVRISPDGQVGIGTKEPQAALDVAGEIRTRDGIRFADGSMLTSAGAGSNAPPDGTTPNVSGTGTTGKLVKWTDGATGALGDSVVTESGGNIGIGVAAPTSKLHVSGTANITGSLTLGANATTATGTLSGNFVNAKSQYNLNGNRVLGVSGNSTYPNSNTFAGVGAGAGNTGSYFNSYFGSNAGAATTSGHGNSFFGRDAGLASTTGHSNSFFGLGAGAEMTTGIGNSFYGVNAGRHSTDDQFNSFFGANAGTLNEGGENNAFFGAFAGNANVFGHSNAFFGRNAGRQNKSSYNAFFGRDAGMANTTGSGNAFFGALAGDLNTEGAENAFFGRLAGHSNTTGGSNSFFGNAAGYGNISGGSNSIFGGAAGYNNKAGRNSFFGAAAGFKNTTGEDNSFFGQAAGRETNTGARNTFIGQEAGKTNTTGNNNTIVGADANVATGGQSFSTAIGSGAKVSTSNTVVLGRSADTVRIPGNLLVTGAVSKGGGSFVIDHPLDPLNKYLYHSFVESPDMMNIYNGNVTTNARGHAVVRLPAYFEALNRDFRYQLTVMGRFAQAIVARKISGNSFVIKTNRPRVEVSWQVTGVRRDAYANTNRIRVEEEKPERERGLYLHPEAFGRTKQ